MTASGIDKDEILRSVRAERKRTASFLRTLEPPQWDTVALPGWRIREVVAHLISLDVSALNGAILPLAFGSMEKLERWNDRQVAKRADRPPAELLLGVERWGARFARLAAAIPNGLYQVAMPTLWGRGPGGLLIWSRAYDDWVHRQDMRRALGLPEEDADLASVASFLLWAGAARVLPELGGRGGTVEIRLDGVPIPRHVFDLTAGGLVEGGDGQADARIRAPKPAPFVMAAAGRRPTFDELRDRGDLDVEGDDTLAKEFLEAFRVV